MTIGVIGVVRGRVQGVFFRRHVQGIAATNAVRGYARNLPNGSVEVLLCGTEKDVAQVQKAVEMGSPSARVEAVAWRDVVDSGCAGFSVR